MNKRSPFVRSRLSGGVVAAAGLSLMLVAVPSAAHAEPLVIDFSGPGYTTGALAPAGQNGWTGGAYDYSLDDNAAWPASGLGPGVSLRYANTIVDGGVSQLAAPALTEAAGESTTGAPHSTFEASFRITSATGAFQDGLDTAVAIDEGGSRYGGWVHFLHSGGELKIGTIWLPSTAATANVGDWLSQTVASVPASQSHDIRLVTTFIDGPANDTLQIWVDGTLAATVPTWEHYTDVAGGSTPQTVNRVIFHTRGSAPTSAALDGPQPGYLSGQPAVADVDGFLFDNLSYRSVTPTTPAADDETLADTGADSGWLLAGGAALLTLGAGALLISARRRAVAQQ